MIAQYTLNSYIFSIQLNIKNIAYNNLMFQFTKRLTSLAVRNASVMLQYRGARYFCNQSKTLNPTYAKIREVYLGKGNKSK